MDDAILAECLAALHPLHVAPPLKVYEYAMQDGRRTIPGGWADSSWWVDDPHDTPEDADVILLIDPNPTGERDE